MAVFRLAPAATIVSKGWIFPVEMTLIAPRIAHHPSRLPGMELSTIGRITVVAILAIGAGPTSLGAEEDSTVFPVLELESANVREAEPSAKGSFALLPPRVTGPVDGSLPAATPPITSRENVGMAAADSPPASDEPRFVLAPDLVAEGMASPVPETEPPARGPVTWWSQQVGQALRPGARPQAVSPQSLISAALAHSSRLRVLGDSPLIRETAIVESEAEFDWSAFLESKWADLDEPVGSLLTTGGPPRFLNDVFTYRSGVRRKDSTGGRFEMGQAYGTEKSNSAFLIPNPQGTSRLTINYTHPMLRGGGRIYNTSLIVLAQADTAMARDDFAAQLQNHLTEVVRGYWTLYQERGSLLQRDNLYRQAQSILAQLKYRQEIDVLQNQIVRAEAAVSSRRSDLYRAEAAVKNAEARIRALVNAPELGVLDEVELTPEASPSTEACPLEMAPSIEVAIRNRPEIRLSMKQIQAAGVRLDVSKNELLPVLDVILETYVAGLRGDRDVASAFTDQFQAGAPSYTAGVRMEIPLRNRAAKARFQRRAIETRQFQHQLKTTLAALQLEVEVAVREVKTSHREILAKYQAMLAAANEVDFIKGRWELLADDDRAAGLVLEDLLGAQERLTQQEFETMTAEVNFNLAVVELQRVMGTLLCVEKVRGTQQTDG